MERNKMEYFTTLDVYLAAYLFYHNQEPVLKSDKNRGRVIFVFPNTTEVSRLVFQFNSNLPVSVADYVTIVKTLRGRLLQMKGSRI